MKRLIDKLKQQCDVSIGSFAYGLVVVSAVVMVLANWRLGLGVGFWAHNHQLRSEWAVFQASIVGSVIGALMAAIGLWRGKQTKKCQWALWIFGVIVVFLIALPRIVPTETR